MTMLATSDSYHLYADTDTVWSCFNCLHPPLGWMLYKGRDSIILLYSSKLTLSVQ